jgi:hypothetical protein
MVQKGTKRYETFGFVAKYKASRFFEAEVKICENCAEKCQDAFGAM